MLMLNFLKACLHWNEQMSIIGLSLQVEVLVYQHMVYYTRPCDTSVLILCTGRVRNKGGLSLA